METSNMNMFNFDWKKVAENANDDAYNEKHKANVIVDKQHVLNSALTNREPQNPNAPVNTVTTQTSGYGRTN